jgi:3-oxoacyl-[acyl-carrier-protein] synthase-3
MAKNSFQCARIAGIVGYVPDNKKSIFDIGRPYFSDDFINRISETVGTKNFYFAEGDLSSGDMGIAAARRLMADLSWDPSEVDGLIYVSQSLDYIVPPTSSRAQYELGLPESAYLMDTNYGCMGFVYALMNAYHLIKCGTCKRIIIVTAEIHYRYIDKSDEATALIFGDGAAATAVEYSESAPMTSFMTYTDGSCYKDITLGWHKQAPNEAITDRDHVFMDGEAVTKFMFKKLPVFVNELIEYHGCEKEDIDLFLFHQANAFILRFLAKRMKLDLDKVLINIDSFGNTSSSSIPLLLCDKCGELFAGEQKKVMAVGFGSGFIIAGMIADIGDLGSGDVLIGKDKIYGQPGTV